MIIFDITCDQMDFRHQEFTEYSAVPSDHCSLPASLTYVSRTARNWLNTLKE